MKRNEKWFAKMKIKKPKFLFCCLVFGRKKKEERREKKEEPTRGREEERKREERRKSQSRKRKKEKGREREKIFGMGKNHSRQQDEKEKGERPKKIKVALIGDGGAGKSGLVVQLVSNQFIEEYDPTIGERFCLYCFVLLFFFVLKKWVFSYRKVIQSKDDGKDLLLELHGLFFSSWKRHTETDCSFSFL